MAQGIRNSITDEVLVYNNRELSLVNSFILSSSGNTNFALLQKNSRKQLFNFLHNTSSNSRISLHSENTAYRIRRSIF